MKKSTKFFCVLSFLSIVLGLILCGISFGFGANFNDITREFANNKILSYFYRNDNSDLDKDALIWENPDFSQENYFFVEPSGKENPIKSMEINIDSCSLTFLQGENLQIKVSNLQENNISCKISKSGVFKIQDSSTFGLLNIFSRKSFSKNGMIEVTLPFSINLENLSIKNNNGSVSILNNSINCNKLLIQNENGEIAMTDFTSKESDIFTNYGTLFLSGNLFNQTKLDCASGKIDLAIGNDFSYKVGRGLGSIIINGESFSNSSKNISSTKQTNHLNIQCDLGTVNIYSK